MKNKKELLKYIVAFVIGDGFLSRSKINSNSYYTCGQRSDRSEFIEFQKTILSQLTEVTTFKEKNRDYYKLRTRVHPLYTKVRQRLYKDNKRVLDPHYLKLLDEEALAIIYMSDGYTRVIERKNGYRYVRIKISTHSYSYFDNCAFKDFIKEKFDINFKVQMEKDKRYNSIYYYLLATKDEAIKFLNLTEKYALNCFKYKWQI